MSITMRLCASLFVAVLIGRYVYGEATDDVPTENNMLRLELMLTKLSNRVSDQNTDICEANAKVQENELKVTEIRQQLEEKFSELLQAQRTLAEQVESQNETLQRQAEEIALLANAQKGVCPEGFTKHKNSCYKVGGVQKTWPEALAICKQYGAHLAIEETHEEQTFLQNIARDGQDACYWVAATDAFVEGRWEWIAGETRKAATNLDWYPGQPNNYQDSDCACLFKVYKYGLVDEPCSFTYDFFCEIDLEQ